MFISKTVNIYYYKYSIDGMNIILVSILLYCVSILSSSEWLVFNTKCSSFQLQSNLYVKGHSKEPENVAFISSFPLYTGKYYVHCSLMGKMRLPFIDSD